MSKSINLVIPDHLVQLVTQKVARKAQALADRLATGAARSSDVRIEVSSDSLLVIGKASRGLRAEYGTLQRPPQLNATQAIIAVATGDAS